VSVGNGQTQVYHNTGDGYSQIHTLTYGSAADYTTGCSFDAQGNFYGTNFTQSKIVEFSANPPHNSVQIIDTSTQGAANNESLVFNASNPQNFYVGNAAGNNQVLKYDATGAFVRAYTVATENRGSDWIDLAKDGKTLFYTSEGVLIKRFDVSANTQPANFATLSDGKAFALRLLPPFDGSGGLLVADTVNIKRLNSSGAVIQTYPRAGDLPLETGAWFALNLDSNGTSFWASNLGSGNVYRFNISSGVVEATIQTGVSSGTGTGTYGVCVVGQPGPVSSQPVTYNPGANVENHALYSPGTKSANFWGATIDVVLSSFTLGVAQFETSCSSLTPRLKKYFSTDPRLPFPIPAVDNSCYYYHVTVPPDLYNGGPLGGPKYTGGIHLNTGYVDPLLALLPPSFQPSPFGLCDVLGAAPRYLDAPSTPFTSGDPADYYFTYDATDFNNPFGTFPDPTLPGGPLPKINDYVAVCRFPTGSATLNPPPGGTFTGTITFTARVRRNDGSIVPDAVDPVAKNYMPLSVANLTSPPAKLVEARGASDCSNVQAQVPCSTAAFFVFHPENGNYIGTLPLAGLVSGTTYTACIDSFRNPTAYVHDPPPSDPTQPPPYFARRCTTFKVQ
jgi:hypothetical protein